ncbi:MAG: hypothetical protein WC642_06100, partial [Nocardioides sp.]
PTAWSSKTLWSIITACSRGAPDQPECATATTPSPTVRAGPTCSCNTAVLCRGHHRIKTHGGWTYDVLDRGTYLWHSPHGHLYRRDHTGTEPLGDRQP